MPDKTEFVETFQDAQEDLERREKNRNKRRTMMMWKNALDEQWRNRPIEATRKIIDRQPRIMRATIEADGIAVRERLPVCPSPAQLPVGCPPPKNNNSHWPA